MDLTEKVNFQNHGAKKSGDRRWEVGTVWRPEGRDMLYPTWCGSKEIKVTETRTWLMKMVAC